MAIRLAVDGRGRLHRATLKRLVSLSEGAVELVLHVGTKGADINGANVNQMREQSEGSSLFPPDFRLQGVDLPLIASPDYRQAVETAIDQLQRNDATYRYRSHNLKNLQDYLDYYHLMAEAFAQRLISSGATHVLFINIPHIGYDTVLYQVARALGLKTILLYQSIFPDRFFSMEKVGDLGLLDVTSSAAQPVAIEKEVPPDFTYMDSRWQQPAPRGRLGRRAVNRFLKHLMLRSPARLLDIGYLRSTLGRMSAIYAQMPDWRDPFARFFHDNELAYFEHLAEYEQAVVDYDVKFIYVPLQNQPELSTSALGGVFRDQLLMLEVLSRDLPKDWKIYVKENPRQGAFARGPLYFHRLKRIAGVEHLPSGTNTHMLSRHAQFTATVTSNAGWESVRKGRPAMTFGAPWYRSLPGVVQWAPGLDYEEIAAMKIDHAELERAYGCILSRSHQGTIDAFYAKAFSEDEIENNSEQIAGTLLKVLTGQVPLSFSASLTV